MDQFGVEGCGFLCLQAWHFRDFKTTTHVFMLEVDFKAKRAVKSHPPSRLECGGGQCREEVHTDEMKFCEHRLGDVNPQTEISHTVSEFLST